MNKRIQELLKQAGAEFNEHQDKEWCYSGFDPEMFTRLIALECIKLVQNCMPDNCYRKEKSPDYIFGWEVASDVIIDELALVFNVAPKE